VHSLVELRSTKMDCVQYTKNKYNKNGLCTIQKINTKMDGVLLDVGHEPVPEVSDVALDEAAGLLAVEVKKAQLTLQLGHHGAAQSSFFSKIFRVARWFYFQTKIPISGKFCWS
jgi:hypothetical protein